MDFMFSGLRDAAAARRLVRKALTNPSHSQPRVVNTDQARLYILEQDHRAIKRRVKSRQGFGEFHAVRRTIQGYEAMHMIRKGQGRRVNGWDVRRQIQFINKLFEVAA